MSDSEATTGWADADSSGAPDRDLTGQLLGGEFLVERLIGRGGMGEVYLARQQGLNRPVALKVLRPDLVSNPTYLSRFEVEATAVARLNHPNIVQVYTLGRDGDLRFIAMEYVQGTNLRDYLRKKGTVELPLAFSIMRQTCQAMAAASELGLIHRDIKPENLMLTRKGQVKVADFGLCREQGAEALHLTQEGVTLGTPMYMSPEQVRGLSLDHRSDLYSMGVTFYHMLAGVPPFRAETAVAVALKHLQEQPIDLSVHRPDLPPELVKLVMKLMAKKPEDRYKSAGELDRELLRLRGIVTATQSIPTISTGEPTPSPLPGSSIASGPSILQRTAWRIGQLRLGGGTLVTLGGLGLLVGAALGWSARPTDMLSGGAPAGPPALWMAPAWESIPKQATAQDQLRYAQLLARPSDRSAALLAVPGHFPRAEPWGSTAYTQLARALFDRLDHLGLNALADSLEAEPEAATQRRRLADICRAASNALEDRPDLALEHLTARAPAPPYLEPALAELALEVAEWARSSPSASPLAAQWTNVREDLLQALRIVTFDPAERFEPGRRRPQARP
ncbi:protein kinase domain-containing protein [Tautonia marina]|uniref:protein kinase domain-containing protein n=1 Tax=Tautonia marina TaxID=2653855 RepID=UPI0012605FE9|nr:protein kinase [Tautonia marina]